MRSFLLIVLTQFILISVFSQEVLNDLFVNPALVNKKCHATNKSAKTALELPFFDDFSVISDYPNDELWEDKHVFINATYPINPPSIGVATFDGVNANGFVYESLSETPSPADTLTSNIIDMRTVNQNATYLSFYYQPQGNGNAPEFNDSLVLNIISKNSAYRVWYDNGTDYKSFVRDSLLIPQSYIDTLEFKLVNIKLDNPAFFTDSFQIQFINYVSIPGLFNPSGRTNADHWNIDYVYLNDDRSQGDTIFHDVAMVEPSSLFMSNFNSVPWRHFETVILKELDDLKFHIRNNDEIMRSMHQLIVGITDLKDNTVNNFYIGQQNLNKFMNYSDLLWNFNTSPIEWYEADSAIFEVSGELLTGDADFADNNYTSRIVKFKNYYAYDDGTAEKAYGVDAENAKVAYKYKIYKGDSLRAVQMHFVRNKEEYSAMQSFTLCVWDNYNDEPGNIIIKESGKKPVFTDNLNEFVTIRFDTTIYLEGTFFIGWEQNSDELMNLGYDANTIRQKKIFYNVSSSWYESDYMGSLMMRPIFSQNKLENSIIENKKVLPLKISPNPSNGFIIINSESGFARGQMQVFDYLGKTVFKGQVNTNETINLNLNHLNNGLYIVTYYSQKGIQKSARLVISK